MQRDCRLDELGNIVLRLNFPDNNVIEWWIETLIERSLMDRYFPSEYYNIIESQYQRLEKFGSRYMPNWAKEKFLE